MKTENKINDILNLIQNMYSTESTITPTSSACYKASTSWTAQRTIASVKYNVTYLNAKIIGRTKCSSSAIPDSSWARTPPPGLICTRFIEQCSPSGNCPQDLKPCSSTSTPIIYMPRNPNKNCEFFPCDSVQPLPLTCPDNFINTSWTFGAGSGTEFLNNIFTGLSVSFQKETTLSSIKGSSAMSYGFWKNCPNSQNINGCSFPSGSCPSSTGCKNVNKVGAASLICQNFSNPQTKKIHSGKTETFTISAWDKRSFSGTVYNYRIEITIKYDVTAVLSSTWLRLTNPNHNCGSCAVSPADAAIYLSTPDFDNTNDLFNLAQNLDFIRAISLRF